MSATLDRLLCSAVLLCAATTFAAGAEVWPSKARRLDDGRIEYTYDLRPVKSGQISVDLGDDSDDAAVAAFRKALPTETKVIVSPAKAKVNLHAPAGLEAAPLSSSFSSVSDGAFTPGPWDTRERKKGVPAFHPDAPKLLPSVDLLLWRQQLLEEEIDAGLLDALQNGGAGLSLGREAVLQKILAASVVRAKSSAGDTQAGARRLAARIAALISLQTGRVPDQVRGDPELMSRVGEESAALSKPRPHFPPRPMVHWTKRLRDAHAFDEGLAVPFGIDREGVAAALTFNAILEGDPALAKAWAALLDARAWVNAKAADDRLADFKAAEGEDGAAGALDHMADFLSRLGSESLATKKGAPILCAARTPTERFIAQLEGAEQLNAIEELTLAVQDGRVSLEADPSEGWGAGRNAWRRELLRPEATAKGKVAATGEYKERLVRTFQALYGLDADVSGSESSDADGDDVREARVRLMVPPLLEVEPLADAYDRAAQTWTRLGDLAAAHPKIGQAHGMLPDGSARGPTIAKDAQAQAQLMRGLSFAATVAAGGPEPTSDADRALMKAALKFLASWKADAELGRDARYLLPVGDALDPGTVVHSGIVGIGRREVIVSFEGTPDTEVQAKDPSLFETDTTAAQRYQVPVLVTAAVTVARDAPIDPAEFRALCDKAGRKRDAIVQALPGALVKTMTPVVDTKP